MGAGVRRPARVDLTRSDAKEMTFILEHPPELTSDGRIVAPVPPPSANAFASPFSFERGQVFSTNQSTVVEEGQQDQQIRGQVRKFTVSSFILLPTLLDAHFVVVHMRSPALEINGQRCVLLGVGPERLLDEGIIALTARFEAVNLPAQASLSAIYATGVQKDRATDLAVRFVASRLVQHSHRDERPHAPIPS
jgi:hypothetical protein